MMMMILGVAFDGESSSAHKGVVVGENKSYQSPIGTKCMSGDSLTAVERQSNHLKDQK